MSVSAITYRDEEIGAASTCGAQSSLCIVGSMQIVWWCQYMSIPPRLAALPSGAIEACCILCFVRLFWVIFQNYCICSLHSMRILASIPDNR